MLFAVALMASCNNAGNKADANQSEAGAANDGIGIMDFKESEFNFGTIKEGEVIKHDFIFNNTGTSPVILSQVSASCGCTTPSYTSEPVLPGKEGKISVEFNSAGQVGQQQKIISIASNAESKVMTVQLRGTVEAK